MIDLKAIEKRARVATPIDKWRSADDLFYMDSECDGLGMIDCEFIAHAREDIPALIARVKELESTIDDLNYELECALSCEPMKSDLIMRVRELERDVESYKEEIKTLHEDYYGWR